MSVLQEANVLLLCQSTSNAGAKRTRYVKLWHVFCRNLLYKFSMHYYKCQQEATTDCIEVLKDSQTLRTMWNAAKTNLPKKNETKFDSH